MDALTPEAWTLAAIVAVVVVLWFTEALPLAVTALLGAAACVLLGVAPAKEVFAPFADPLIFLFIGSFLLAEAIRLHGLDRRLAYNLSSVYELPFGKGQKYATSGLAGKITQETLLIQLAAGNVFVDDFDVDAELEATRQLQGQALDRIAGNLRGPVVDENGSEETEGPGEEDDT